MTGRASLRTSVAIQRPPEAVFDYLLDVSRHSEWSPKAYRTEGLTPGPVAVGTRFTSYGYVPRDAEHRNDVEVTAVERPTRLVLTSTEGSEQFVNTFTLTPEGSGTRVERLMDMPKPGGVLGLAFPLLLGGYVKPAVQKGMNRLRDNLQTSSAGG